MKANQSFKQNDDAVSPVIGVILMVAITVVLAAVVFVLVGNLTESGDESPQITFIKDEQANTLTVQNINWGGSELHWSLNGTAVSSTTNLVDVASTGAACTVSPATDVVNAGDILTCAAGTVSVVFGDTDTLIATYTFS